MQCHRAFPQLESAGEVVGKDAPNRLPFIPNLEALMAHSPISRVLLAALSHLALAVTLVGDGFASAVVYLHRVLHFDWRPEAAAALALDRLSHDIDTKPVDGMRRFRSYLQRLGLHRLFTGDGFVEPQAVGAA